MRLVLEAPIVDVELQLRFGRARITVPADAVVDLEGLQDGVQATARKRNAGVSARLVVTFSRRIALARHSVSPIDG